MAVVAIVFYFLLYNFSLEIVLIHAEDQKGLK